MLPVTNTIYSDQNKVDTIVTQEMEKHFKIKCAFHQNGVFLKLQCCNKKSGVALFLHPAPLPTSQSSPDVPCPGNNYQMEAGSHLQRG